jgi:serine/threonine-protein kinase
MPPASERWARVKELFEAAADLAPNERAALLNKECNGDDALRREVESLLDADNQTDGFIEQPAFEIPRDLFPDAQEEALAGRQFGAYQIIREIGRGGLGAVYLAARADDEYRKEVAIKLVRRGLDTEDILRRFRNERQILAQLDHPNIARLIDGGTTDEGLPYFVMEYVNGQPITAYCDAKALPTAERLTLFRKVCAAVTYAHQNLVIHRDLKPSNILVTLEGEPKLLDFGIAKLLSTGDELFTQTIPALRVMTPEYASPEQVKGNKIMTTSDVYSLGVLLYELLTGQRPYRLKTRTAEEIARAITDQEPERPSTAVTRASNSPQSGPSRTGVFRNPKSLRGDLDNIVLMAMRKEPARRYASVGQFSEDIRRHLAGLPVVARKDTVSYRTGKFVTRHRIGVAAAALILLSLIGGIIATLIQVRTARRERAKAEAISVFLGRTLNASNPDRNLNGQATVKDLLDDASKRLATEELSDQPEVKAELQRIIGESYFSLGQYDLAEQNLTAALQTQTRIAGEDGIATLKTGVSMATLWSGAKGDYVKANKFYLANLSRLRAEQKKGTIQTDYLVAALNGFALLRRAQGDSREAEILLREELTLQPLVSPEQKNSLGVAQAILALTLADQGKFEEAIKIVREKIETIRGKKQEASPELAANLTGLGSFLLENGQAAESLENLREAEAIYRKRYSDANLQLGDNLRLQAQAFFDGGKHSEAEARINETLKIYRAATNPQFINYATALMVEGFIYSQTGRIAEAEKLLREAVRIRSENMPETHFLRATANGALGEFLTAQTRFPEAEPFLLASHESLKKSQAANSPRMKRALQRLANLYEAWNKPEQAAPYRALLAAGANEGA